MSQTCKEKLKKLQYPLAVVPFYGTTVFVMLKELNQAELRSCGDFSLIETKEDKLRTEAPTIIEMVEYTKLMARIAEVSLVKPTYKEIMTMYDEDARLKDFEKTLRDMKEESFLLPEGTEKTELEGRIARVEVWCYTVLPDDFLAAIASYALGMDKTDIKTITKDTLINIAILAERGHDNPADHVDGRFTPFMKDDINGRAWAELSRWRAEASRKENKNRIKTVADRMADNGD